MPGKFPIFLDITGKKILVYGAGKIASRRVASLLGFGPSVTVCAPEASLMIQRAAEDKKLVWLKEAYCPGSIPKDTWMTLAATSDPFINEEICRECREKQILVNVCSNQELCDFQFPGIVAKGDLVIGVNAGGKDHALARKWTDQIRKEVEKDGNDNQAEAASHIGESKKDGAGNPHG